MKNLYKIENELYIVSSSEKIKENTQTHIQGFNGDWFYNTIYNFIARTGDITSYDFKIILTTNKLLIKDGVQQIDDKFLEWFVKNSSCKEVEVENICNNCGDRDCIHAICHSQITKAKGDTYKIIIPKEEPKQETQGYICPKTKILCDDECCVSAEDCHIEAGIDVISEPKQETLEEVAKNATKMYVNEREKQTVYLSFIEGAKWQQQQMYSEEADLWCSYKIGFGDGYNKAKETYQFTEEDIIEFAQYVLDNISYNNDKLEEMLFTWKKQQIKTIYYE